MPCISHSAAGGHQDEPDQRVGDTWISDKDGRSSGSDGSDCPDESAGLDSYAHLTSLHEKFLFAVITDGPLPPGVFKPLLKEPWLIDFLLSRPDKLQRLFMLSVLVAPDDLQPMLMEPEMLLLLIRKVRILRLFGMMQMGMEMEAGPLEKRQFMMEKRLFMMDIHSIMADKSGYESAFLNSEVYQIARTNAIENPFSKDIMMVSRANIGGSSFGQTASTLTGGNLYRATDLATNQKPIVIYDSATPVSVTGDGDLFRPVLYEEEGYGLRAANGTEIKSNFCGYVSHERFEVPHVYFSDDVGPRSIISGVELDLLGYAICCSSGVVMVWDTDKRELVGKGRLVDETRYEMDFLRIPFNKDLVPSPELQELPLPDGHGPLPWEVVSEVLEVVAEVPDVQVADAHGPLSEEPAIVTTAWTVLCTILRRIVGFVPKRVSTQAPRRPLV